MKSRAIERDRQTETEAEKESIGDIRLLSI